MLCYYEMVNVILVSEDLHSDAGCKFFSPSLIIGEISNVVVPCTDVCSATKRCNS